MHHNLYGHFLELGINLLRRRNGSGGGGAALLSLALRNVLELHKYPEDAAFHHELCDRIPYRRNTPFKEGEDIVIKNTGVVKCYKLFQ
eukprot:SAG11_NODE_4735_length_1787_cov_1.344194_4_plen_87_part_01